MYEENIKKHFSEYYDYWDDSFKSFQDFLIKYKTSEDVKLNEPANKHLLDLSERSELVQRLQWKQIGEFILSRKQDLKKLNNQDVFENMLETYFSKTFYI